jgi:hypothetical protein
MSYREQNGQIVLTMSLADYDQLLMLGGYVIGCAMRAGANSLAPRFVTLLNRLNDGNPNFTPYEVKPK